MGKEKKGRKIARPGHRAFLIIHQQHWPPLKLCSSLSCPPPNVRTWMCFCPWGRISINFITYTWGWKRGRKKPESPPRGQPRPFPRGPTIGSPGQAAKQQGLKRKLRGSQDGPLSPVRLVPADSPHTSAVMHPPPPTDKGRGQNPKTEGRRSVALPLQSLDPSIPIHNHGVRQARKGKTSIIY